MTSAPPLDRMSEDELLERARKAMSRAVSLPVGSLGRSIQWGVFDTIEAQTRLQIENSPGRLPRMSGQAGTARSQAWSSVR
jgi:hypothetical protein